MSSTLDPTGQRLSAEEKRRRLAQILRQKATRATRILVLQEDASALFGFLEFSTDLFEAATVERMRGHLGTLMAGVAADPGRRISELPLLSADERRRVVQEWNATHRPHPAGPPVHERVAEQARRRPDAPAVVAGDTALFRNPVRPETNTLFSQLMFAHKVNPQTVLFVGSTDNQLGLHDVDLTRTGRTFFVKLGYTLRL